MQLFIGVILFFFSILFSCFIQAREISIVTVDWPPYYSKSLKDDGPLSVITREAFKVKGHTVNILFLPWKRALREVKYGRADMILGAYFTDKRSKAYIFTDPIYEVRDHVIGLKSNGITTFNTLEDLKDYTFGTTLGYAYSKEFTQASYLNREEVSSDYLNIKKLFANRVQFVVMNTAAFRGTLNLVPIKDRKEYVLLSPPLSVNPIYNLFSKKITDSLQLREDFNLGLKHIKENGRYDAITKEFGIH